MGTSKPPLCYPGNVVEALGFRGNVAELKDLTRPLCFPNFLRFEKYQTYLHFFQGLFSFPFCVFELLPVVRRNSANFIGTALWSFERYCGTWILVSLVMSCEEERRSPGLEAVIQVSLVGFYSELHL